MKYNRLQALREYILKNHKVEITDVAEKMQVSVETVRRDFGVLEEEGFLKKVYGGAELADDNVMEWTIWEPILETPNSREMCRFISFRMLWRKAISAITISRS